MWIKWRSQITTAAGDDIILLYNDCRKPGLPYQIEYRRLILNETDSFTKEWEIQEVLDKLLTDEDLARLFANAERRKHDLQKH